MRDVEIILLCEDRQTDSFVRRFLRHRNFKERDIKTLPLPHSSGAGDQWVRKQYPEQLKAIRNKRDAYLIVVIDADVGTINDRHRELATACREKGIPSRDKKDSNVLHIIPRRNIETWLAYLDGNNVDESTVYPKLKRESHCKEHAENLHNMCQSDQRLREPAPPSLQEACNEYHKLQR